MRYKDIERVNKNIQFIEKKVKENAAILQQIESYMNHILTEIKKREKELTDEITKLTSQDLDLKLTFDQILDEIAKELNITRDQIFIQFEPIVHLGVGRQIPRTKEEALERELGNQEKIVVTFKIATDIKNLRTNGCYVSRDERAVWKDNDPIYTDFSYKYEVKPHDIQGDGKTFIDCLELTDYETLVQSRSANPYKHKDDPVLKVGKKYGNLYFYIHPEYYSLRGRYLSNAIKRLLNEDELARYYELSEKIKVLKEEKMRVIIFKHYIENKKGKLKEKVEEKNEEDIQEIKNLVWPEITVRLGDFLKGIYSSEDNSLNLENTQVEVWEPSLEDDVRENTTSFLRLIMRTENGQNVLSFFWPISYSDLMYDGLSLFEHFSNNDTAEFKNCWKGFSEIKDFMLVLNPEHLFENTYYHPETTYYGDPCWLDDQILNIKTIREAIIKSMYKQIQREVNTQRPTKVKIITK